MVVPAILVPLIPWLWKGAVIASPFVLDWYYSYLYSDNPSQPLMDNFRFIATTADSIICGLFLFAYALFGCHVRAKMNSPRRGGDHDHDESRAGLYAKYEWDGSQSPGVMRVVWNRLASLWLSQNAMPLLGIPMPTMAFWQGAVTVTVLDIVGITWCKMRAIAYLCWKPWCILTDRAHHRSWQDPHYDAITARIGFICMTIWYAANGAMTWAAWHKFRMDEQTQEVIRVIFVAVSPWIANGKLSRVLVRFARYALQLQPDGPNRHSNGTGEQQELPPGFVTPAVQPGPGIANRLHALHAAMQPPPSLSSSSHVVPPAIAPVPLLQQAIASPVPVINPPSVVYVAAANTPPIPVS